MLAPYTEAIEDPELRALCVASLGRYAAFVEAVANETGLDAQLRLEGIISAAYDDDAVGRLEQRAASLAGAGVPHAFCERSDALRLEPALGKRVRSALLVRPEGTVDNRRLGRALLAGCEALGVGVGADARDLQVECDRRRVLGVRSHRGFSPATWVINAAGAWAAQIPGVPPQAVPPVEPVKGQMLALAMPRGFLKRPAWVPGAYLVPRDDGRLLVGATVERAGFDTRVTAEGLRRLLEAALDAAPALRDLAVTESWAGLRPGSPDGRPFIGPSALEGLLVATWRGRDWILLAPMPAPLIAECVEGKNRSDLSPWLPLRMQMHAGRTVVA